MSAFDIEQEYFFEALGRVVHSSARMQDELQCLIFGFLSGGDGFAVVTTDMSYAQLNHIANAMADRLLRARDFKPLAAILKDAAALYEKRNIFVHSQWMEGGDDFYWSDRWRAKGKLVHLEEVYHVTQISDVAEELDSCRKRLNKFMSRRRFEDRTMFHEQVGTLRLAKRTLAREREKARIRAQAKKANQK